MKILHKLLCSFFILFLFLSCKSVSKNNTQIPKNPKDSITLLFAGDIMAHNVNYNMKDYNIIWNDIREEVQSADFAFANLEAPIDSTKKASSYPYFNMPQAYVQSAIDAGFNVFSLSNNHTNDQLLEGMLETQKSADLFTQKESQNGNKVYFSGLKINPESDYSFNIIEKNGWKILFLPITEILNKPIANQYINYVSTSEKKRQLFIEYCKKIKEENPCDLFILSIHANETEYLRSVTKTQNNYYNDLLDSGVDIIFANHAHLIKDRKIIKKNDETKIIMYANGNTISGQRTRPNFSSDNPNSKTDNTGDGLLYKVTFKKNKNKKPEIITTQNIFITTYITPKREYIIKKMDNNFLDYLYENSRIDWAKYIEKRIKINQTDTKEIFECQ